jgi:hypothetical protein
MSIAFESRNWHPDAGTYSGKPFFVCVLNKNAEMFLIGGVL